MHAHGQKRDSLPSDPVTVPILPHLPKQRKRHHHHRPGAAHDRGLPPDRAGRLRRKDHMANKLQRPDILLRNPQIHPAAHSRKLHHTRRFHLSANASNHHNKRGIHRNHQDNPKRQRPRNPPRPSKRTQSTINIQHPNPHNRLRPPKLLPTHPPPLRPRLRPPNNQHPQRHPNHPNPPPHPPLRARQPYVPHSSPYHPRSLMSRIPTPGRRGGAAGAGGRDTGWRVSSGASRRSTCRS